MALFWNIALFMWLTVLIMWVFWLTRCKRRKAGRP